MNRRIAIIGPALGALLALGACDNVQRSMVFMTGTTVGVDVAVAPQSDAPVHLTVGYKRAEVLFDPIMEDCDCLIDLQACEHGKQPAAPGAVASAPAGAGGATAVAAAPEGETTTAPTNRKTRYKIKDQPHSVLAKLLGDVNATARTGTGPEATTTVSVAQWFASGKAAELLAAGGGAAALTDNPAVAKQVAEATKSFGASLKEREQGVLPQTVAAMHDALAALGTAGDAESARLAADMNAVAADIGLPATFGFTTYVLGAPPTGGARNLVQAASLPLATDPLPADITGVVSYYTAVHASVVHLDRIVKVLDLDPALLTLPAGVTPASLRSDLAARRATLTALTKQISTNERIVRAAKRLQDRLQAP